MVSQKLLTGVVNMKTSARVTSDVGDAVAVLKNGGVVVFPTETCYGIGCDARNAVAIERIKVIKNRPDAMPVSVVVKDMVMALEYGDFSKLAVDIVRKHWPGPLTVVVPIGKKGLADNLSQNKTVGMRISNSKCVEEMMSMIDFPVVATSANVHGESCAYTVEEALEQFAEHGIEPDMYLDGGRLAETPPSMIIEVVNGEVLVHRQGSFKF